MISPAGVAVACASRAGEAGRYICTVFLPSTRPAPRNPPRAPPARPCSPRSAGQAKRWRSSQRPGGTDGETPWLASTHHDSPTRRLVLALPQAPGQVVGERIRPAVTRAGASGAAAPRERVLDRATRRLAVAPDAGTPAPCPGCVSIQGGTRTRRCDTPSGGGARSARSFKRKRCCGGACGRRLAAALSRVAWRDKIRRIGEKAVRDVVAKKRC